MESCHCTAREERFSWFPVAKEDGSVKLAGKVALVTGAARGIGRGIALELARAGADVCVNDMAPDSAGWEVVAEIRGLGRRLHAVQADVSDRAAVEHMAAECVESLGPIDIAVACAVTSVRQTLLETQAKDLRRAAAFLASDDAAYVCGAVLSVDGGAFVQGPAWGATARHGDE
jgi:NAD(P)-dependent dehydrogenase (short-subunit alcohol dehydrogenase family)